MINKKVLFFVLSLSAMASFAKNADTIYPSIAFYKEQTTAETAIFVNDFKTESLRGDTWFDKLKSEYASYKPIHPYYLKTGKNEIKAEAWSERLEPGSSEPEQRKSQVFIFAVTSLDYINWTSDKNILKVQVPIVERGKKAVNNHVFRSQSFIFDGEIPKWKWIGGVKIERSEPVKESLYRAYEGLWNNLNRLGPTDKTFTTKQKNDFETEVRESTKEFLKASLMRKTGYETIDELFNFAKTLKDRTIHLQLEPLAPIESLGLEIFAQGALAKLVVDPTSYFSHDLVIKFSGGAHDSKSGPGGGVFNIWFRRDSSGKWLIDAISPLSSI